MDLELDHFFILTNKPKETGDLLVSFGLDESFCRVHQGQGTSNRRFEFSNGMLELLYIRDEEECTKGPAKYLNFPERLIDDSASPFGIILTRKNGSKESMPYNGWKYQPDYFDVPNAFHIGDNSKILKEPLCIYVPFVDPITRKVESGKFKSILNVQLYVQLEYPSKTLNTIQSVDRLQIRTGDEHLILLTLDSGESGNSKDFRPNLPLIINW